MTKYIDKYELSKKNVLVVAKFIIIFTSGGHRKIYEIGHKKEMIWCKSK